MTESTQQLAGVEVLGAAAVGAFLLVGLVRSYALRHQILDHPGPRASHSRPTPRGGGLGLVVAAVLVIITVRWPRLDPALALALAAVCLTAAIGWRDDRVSLGVRTRILGHLTAAMLLLPLALWPTVVPVWMGVFAGLWWVFWVVSAINVVNFMDGIDGLIGSQALIFGVHLTLGGQPEGSAALVGLSLAGASAGFLAWNWPPARIFLGDVGSGALGVIFVLGGLLLLREGTFSIVTAFLPLYPLFLDASVTLVRRWKRGERLAQAHRSHLYQRLANGSWGHTRVTLLYAASAAAALPIAMLQSPARTLGVVAYFLLVFAVGWVLDRRVGGT